MNGLSLFSGIAGLDLGLHAAIPGYRTVGYVDYNKSCQQVLQARIKEGRLDDAPIFADISAFDGRQYRGLVDIVACSPPCQDFSTAGRRAGAAGKRNLWPETRRIIGEVAPAQVFFENVPGILSSVADRPDEPPYGYAGTVVGELAEMGYSVRWYVLGARDVGAPHRRDRFFLLAVADAASRGHAEREREREAMGRAEQSYVNGGSAVADGGRQHQHVQQRPHGAEPAAGSGGIQVDCGCGFRFYANSLRKRCPSCGRIRDAAVTYLEHPERERRAEGREEPEAQQGAAAAVGAGGPMGNTWSVLTEQPQRKRARPGVAEIPRASSDFDGSGIPLWPPAPNDVGGWRAVLAVRPDLAPAINGRLSPLFVEWLQGFPMSWTEAPGVSRQKRLEMLGNACVPLQAAAAYRTLLEAA